MKSEIFPELDKLYTSRNPFVRNLFWTRIHTAIAFAEISDDSIILDVGCGSGHLLRSIRKINDKCDCYATDVLESRIKEAVNCKFQVADARKLPFEDNYFDAVFTMDILEHIKDHVENAVKEINRVLKPGGLAILTGPTESRFYRLCRSVLFCLTREKGKYNELLERKEIDYHFHTIYELEERFIEEGFKLVDRRSLPWFPLPPVFRLSKFQK